MPEKPDALRRDVSDLLRRVANAAVTGEFARAQTTSYVGHAAVRTDPRPSLKRHLWELERGKPPEPQAPDAAEVARAKVVQDLTTRIVQVGERLVAQPREKAALEAERERLAAELQAVQGKR